MIRLKEGQRYRRTYDDGGGPTLVLEVLQDSSDDSAEAKIVQTLDMDKSPQHRDFGGLKVWAFLHPWPGITYTHLEGQDAPQ